MIDAHCHISMYPAEMRPSLLAKLADRGFEALLLAGYDPKDWQSQLELKSQSPTLQILPVFGLHPWYAEELSDQDFARSLRDLDQALSSSEAIACGELGLDYFRVKSDKARRRQQSRLEASLDVACSKGLPLVLHCVRAHHDMIRILKSRKKDLSGGMVHSFIGQTQLARTYWELGFCTSISPMTQRTNRDQLYQDMPSDYYLIESDAPQPIDPKGPWEPENMSDPTELLHVAKQVAQARKISIEEVFSHNRANIRQHFPRSRAFLP